MVDAELEETLLASLRTVVDFPVKGIAFKDITTCLQNPKVNKKILEALIALAKTYEIDAVVGLDSRGFLFGNAMAIALGVPFVPVRKKGKLPFDTFSVNYDLEYGQSILEIHQDALKKGDRVLIHDDLLATGGSASAASELVVKLEAKVVAYSFIIRLQELEGFAKLLKNSKNIDCLLSV